MASYRVLSVAPLGKKKYKVTLEGTENIVVSLYPSEIRRYNISEGAEIDGNLYVEIMELLYKRGIERALYYLKTSDKTVFQMRTKLKEGYYPRDVVDRIVGFLLEYSYVDDYRYAENFILYNKNRKSIERMKNDLRLKGISRDILDDVFSNNALYDEDDEAKIIEAYCRKKYKEGMDDVQCNKIIMALLRKGFKYDKVKSILGKVSKETTA